MRVYLTGCTSQLLIVCLLLVFGTANAMTKNGFVLDDAAIPVEEILSGGPPRDGIPALDNPQFLTANAAMFLKKDDRVLGVEIDGVAKAYPIKILDWHEIVNDRIGKQHFVVTYCPLCGTGMAFSVSKGQGSTEFGVSGLLYQSDVLLYDRATESLWSQILGKAVAGKRRDEKLDGLPLIHTDWQDWRQRHPQTLVLSTETGFNRDYTRSPYAGYNESRQLYFKVSNKAPEIYHPKEQVLGLQIDGKYKAYPYSELDKHGRPTFTDTFNGKTVIVHWNGAAQSAHITDENGAVMVTTTGFWFAWFTFYPETRLFSAEGGATNE